MLAKKMIGIIMMAISMSTFGTDQDIDIKGIKIGIAKSEVKEKFPNFKDFTIAGVESTYKNLPSDAYFKYKDEMLDQFVFFFDSSKFDQVLQAFNSKYKSMECEKSSVSNAYGASFNQISCSLFDEKSKLSLDKYAGTIDKSAIVLISKKTLYEMEAKRAQNQNDL
jgi:hypothetical protein